MGRLTIERCSGVLGLQDGGRTGYQRYGLSGSGAMDRLAMATANALVGNRADAPALELGLGGGRFVMAAGRGWFAVAGAPCTIRIDGAPMAGHRTVMLEMGAELVIDPPREGSFVYLAVAGGFLADPVLGSVALHLRAGIGGTGGRAFQPGDNLRFTASDGPTQSDRTVDAVALDRDAAIRVMLGPQADHFTKAGIDTLLGSTFTVSHRADRMGYQLEGTAIGHGAGGYNIVSDATVAGSIQVPGNGLPIVLMADRQTTGGYPKIGTVISADLRRLAQRRPGERVRFAAVDLTHAREAAFGQAREFAGLAGRIRVLNGIDVARLYGANLAGQAVDALAVDAAAVDGLDVDALGSEVPRDSA
ncbi:biotin-dependent carboxyltransferase family protein [Methylobacterium sp. 77]|uniref:5-oxoprolinase subunit C family protein n=1 Tax=Methylobacterium sp. 77 TaxID=1101192 RepID=UPI0003702851|nr:biotin-dependent carboxyltransferase family protein [Methylobacterium sp. 77]